MSVRSRILRPSDRLRYSPGSLLLVVGTAGSQPDRFVERVVEERGVVLSLTKVRTLLAGRVSEEEMEPRSRELLEAAIAKRIQTGQSVVVPIAAFDPAERERYVRLAHAERRPRHLILLEAPNDQVADEERAELNELRRALDAGELGAEGFQTVMRLGGSALSEVKRIVFAPPPRED